jgi:hypothetical protein
MQYCKKPGHYGIYSPLKKILFAVFEDIACLLVYQENITKLSFTQRYHNKSCLSFFRYYIIYKLQYFISCLSLSLCVIIFKWSSIFCAN